MGTANSNNEQMSNNGLAGIRYEVRFVLALVAAFRGGSAIDHAEKREEISLKE